MESYRQIKEMYNRGYISEDTTIKASLELLDAMLIKYDRGDLVDKVY